MTPRPRKKPTPPEDEQSDDSSEDRTEITGEYKGGKVSLLIGKQGYILGLAVAFLLFCMGASILLAMIVNAITKLKGE